MASEVVALLDASLDPKQHKDAENALREREKQPGFSLLLLEITASTSYSETTRLASALCFKNLVRRSWTDEEGNHLLPQNEVQIIKQDLVGLMISTPPRIQAQLGEAVSAIAESDFIDRWQGLIDDLVSRLTADDPVVNKGVLEVAHSIFKRWRPLFRSDALFSEINQVLQGFAEPFMYLIQNTDNALDKGGDKAYLERWMAVLDLSFSLIYDLSCQDLPPMFEENLRSLSMLFKKYLDYQNAALDTSDDAESGPVENVKANIFEVLTLWVQKYEDAFDEYIGQFVEGSWTLLTTLGTETKFDLLSSRALNFLTSIASLQNRAEIFNNQEVLSSIVERVIIPNVALRESDVELFEDEPIEFTRRDLEGSDSETRRRAATDFLRQLLRHMQQQLTTIVMSWVDKFLQEYAKDPKENWKSKDTAVYLFCSVAALGLVTTSQGVVSVNSAVDIMDFFKKNVAEDLIQDTSHVVLQVDAIKYLYVFRSQLTKQQWQDVFEQTVRHLGSPNYVVHTYSAITIDRALYLTDDNQEPFIPPSAIKPVAKDILQRLFLLIEKDSAAEKIQENEFLIRCIMRVLVVLREDIEPQFDFVLTNFVNILRVIRHNPSNPRFYYFFFEALGAFIRFTGPTQSSKLEQTLQGPFGEILTDMGHEFVPYIFQLLAALLESNPTGALSDFYQSLISTVLIPSLWEWKGVAPALVRLLSSLVTRGASYMEANNKLEPTLGIFQKLVSSKVNDTYGFDLLETIISSFPVSTLEQYFSPIFQLLLTRLANSKTETFEYRFTRLYHFMSSRTEQGFGPDVVIKILEDIQSGIFAQLYPPIILQASQKLSLPLDRKLAVVSFTKTLGDSEAFAQNYAKGWGRTCEAMLAIMVNPPVFSKQHETLPEQDVDHISFGVGFTALNTIKKPPEDPNSDISDLRTWISQYLREADRRHEGRISGFLDQRLSPDSKAALMAYMQG